MRPAEVVRQLLRKGFDFGALNVGTPPNGRQKGRVEFGLNLGVLTGQIHHGNRL